MSTPISPKDDALEGYLNEERQFVRLPGRKQKKKLDLMISFLANQFEQDTFYSETQVNEILNQNHTFDDPATLRRLLIGTGLMERSRDGRKYWKAK